jgi:HSP20 family protein
MDINSILQHLSTAMLNSEDSDINTLINNFYLPQTDIVVADRYITIFVELPGIEKNDIKLDFFNNKLDITANRKKPYEDEDTDIEVKKSEIHYGQVKRKISLPISVTNKDNVEVTFNNGLLKVVVDKQQEEKNRFSVNLS